MRKFKATKTAYKILLKNSDGLIYPFLRDDNGDEEILCISPNHGRSFLVGRDNDRYIISKGNGLSYTQYTFMNTRELGEDAWGMLLETDAVRDFNLGLEIESLGVKTNKMEYVLKLDQGFRISDSNSDLTIPVLLQYSVESPHRINDAAYMTSQQISNEISKWNALNDRGFKKYHLIAANVLIRNLRILHDNNILHNAIHEQNYTWALELLDFELACSPNYPYSSEDDMRHAKNLYHRELIQTYVIIYHIAEVLREEIDFHAIDALFAEYGFNLSIYQVSPVCDK